MRAHKRERMRLRLFREKKIAAAAALTRFYEILLESTARRETSREDLDDYPYTRVICRH